MQPLRIIHATKLFDSILLISLSGHIRTTSLIGEQVLGFENRRANELFIEYAGLRMNFRLDGSFQKLKHRRSQLIDLHFR